MKMCKYRQDFVVINQLRLRQAPSLQSATSKSHAPLHFWSLATSETSGLFRNGVREWSEDCTPKVIVCGLPRPPKLMKAALLLWKHLCDRYVHKYNAQVNVREQIDLSS
jgi:hypothetical protein